jgi:hypothetical protein
LFQRNGRVARSGALREEYGTAFKQLCRIGYLTDANRAKAIGTDLW